MPRHSVYPFPEPACSIMAVVPITREQLALFYDKHPITPLPKEVQELNERINKLNQRIAKCRSQKVPEVPWEFPHKLDDCYWRNRQLCEEGIESIVQVVKLAEEDYVAKACMEVWDKLKAAEEDVRLQQERNSEGINEQIGAFLPKDFRSAVVRRRAAKAEKKRAKAVRKLVKQGATATEKYELLLKHQMQRRQALVNLGKCKGIFRWLVKRVVGVPVVLLDFAKKINDALGPMEEQRARYGPDFYEITRLGLQIRVLLAQWAIDYDGCFEHEEELIARLEEGTTVYTRELKRIVSFLGELFMKSPWFVSPEDIKKAHEEMDKLAVKEGKAEDLSAGLEGLEDEEEDDDDNEDADDNEESSGETKSSRT